MKLLLTDDYSSEENLIGLSGDNNLLDARFSFEMSGSAMLLGAQQENFKSKLIISTEASHFMEPKGNGMDNLIGDASGYQIVNKRVGAKVRMAENVRNKENRQSLKPFLKWPGGKRWLVDKYREFLPQRINGRYIEPFVGGGAVFFALNPRNAILADVSHDLITTYLGVRNFREDVQRILERHASAHSTGYYYGLRECELEGIAAQAARFLYLNRTCFNGIYRVNREGKFNVPIGSKTKVLLDDDDFAGWSHALNRAEVKVSDFEIVINDARKGDFVFVDPPYTVRHNNNGFIKYNEVLFSWHDQQRLHDCLYRAKARGVRILITNANHQSVRELYSRGFKQHVVSRYSSIAASGSKRDRYEELIIQA